MSTKTIILTSKQIEDLYNHFKEAKQCKTPPYAYYQIKLSDCTITAYTSGKVVFQGKEADFYVSSSTPSSTIKQQNTSLNQYPQCGSDEVGTGDYFGPITVCATYVKAEDIPFLKQLNIQDSKAIDDNQIRKIAPLLCEKLTYSLLILDNSKYNTIHSSFNMVAIKSRLHNQAFVHLKHKLNKLPDLCIIDQFVQGKSYYRYLQGVNEIIEDIHFETKAENKYLSVAAGSIIARYAFLQAFDHMCEHYHFSFNKGAGAKVDQDIIKFVKEYGEKELFNVAKVHFINTKKALGKILIE